MSKHNRKQSRKMFAREMAAATKKMSKGQKKKTSPESLETRFSHLMKNLHDVDAFNNYADAFRSLFIKSQDSTKVQMLRIKGQQVEELTALLKDEMLTSDESRRISRLLKKLKHLY